MVSLTRSVFILYWVKPKVASESVLWNSPNNFAWLSNKIIYDLCVLVFDTLFESLNNSGYQATEWGQILTKHGITPRSFYVVNVGHGQSGRAARIHHFFPSKRSAIFCCLFRVCCWPFFTSRYPAITNHEHNCILQTHIYFGGRIRSTLQKDASTGKTHS